MRWFVFTRPTSSNIAVQIGFLEDSHTALTSSHLTNNLSILKFIKPAIQLVRSFLSANRGVKLKEIQLYR